MPPKKARKTKTSEANRTPPIQLRFTEADLAAIDRLTVLYGGTTRAAAIRNAVHRHLASLEESVPESAPKKTSKKSEGAT